MENIFFRKKEDYTNQLNPVKGYLEQLTHFIATKKQISLDQAKPIAIKLIKERFKDRPVKYFERQENGDRTVENGTMLDYIKKNIAEKNILVPTFTSYMNADVKQSILSSFIAGNVIIRSKAKKEGQAAKAKGEADVADSKNNEQNNMKIRNNSVSGLFGQQACILYNPTAHSTLTSITRTMTSLSNACNERLLAGNRYLPRPSDVYRCIVYEATYANIEQTKQVVDKYNLYLPTIEDTVNLLRRSSDLYFKDDAYYNTYIIPYLKNLSPYHLASICYVGDLYHQRQFNSDFIRTLLDEFTKKVYADNPALDDPNILYSIHEPILMLAHGVFSDEIKGLGKDYKLFNEKGVAGHIYATCLHMQELLHKYKDFFNAFYMQNIVPINSHRLRDMRRRVVVLSDTDSSCFTLDEWINWYHGQYKLNDRSIAIASGVTYIASEAIVNQLAILSKSMNVQQKKLDTLAMKNEYLWQNISTSEASKHYFAWTAIQEGNVFAESELELKGVHLKNSAVPREAVEHGIGLMKHICETVSDNRKVSFNYMLSEVINIENKIISSIEAGDPTYLKRSKIKDETAYSQGRDKSPFQRHLLWEQVFAPTYGDIPPPPYDVVKLPTTITSKTAMKAWIESIDDIELRTRLVNWLIEFRKDKLPTIYLAGDYVAANGIPKEILSVMDIRRIVFDSTMQHRLIMGMLGVFVNEDLLIKEQFKLPA